MKKISNLPVCGRRDKDNQNGCHVAHNEHAVLRVLEQTFHSVSVR